MGREVRNMQMEKHTKGLAAIVSTDSFGRKVHASPRITGDSIDKEYDVKECAVKNPVVEECEEKLAVLGVKSANVDDKNNNGEDQNCKTLDTLKAKSGANGNGHANFTVPKPFSLATEKRGSCVTRHAGTESPVSNSMKSPSPNNLNCLFKTPQPNSPSGSKKPQQTENRKHNDDEDSSSVTSSTAASARSLRSSKPKITIGTAPTFKSSERAEKRKEFYTKLEEKHQALQEERTQCEARTKEEQEAAIKQLRKSMVYKANLVPSFYYEAPPTKAEVKKLPLTRPVSPKFGRRKSCNDAVQSSAVEKRGACTRALRHSLGSSKRQESELASSPRAKIPTILQNGNGNPKAKHQPSSEETAIAAPPYCKIPEQSDEDLVVES